MAVITDTTRRKVLSYRWLAYGMLALVYFFVYFDRLAPAVVSPELVKTFHINAASLGLLSAAYFYPYAVMQFPSGLLSDYLGPRRAVSIFILIAGVGTVLFGAAQSYDIALVGRGIMGIGVAVVYIPVMKILAVWFRKHEFATLTGALLTVGNIGALAASAPLAWLVAQAGWRESFYYLGGVTVVLAILTFTLVRNKPQDLGLPTIDAIDGVQADSTSASATVEEEIPPGRAMKMAVSSRNYFPLAIYAFFVYGTMMGFQGLWGVPYMMDTYGFSKQVASNVLMMWAVGMIFGCPIAGVLSDRIFHNRRTVVLLGSGTYTLLWLLLVLAPGTLNATLLSILFFAMGFTGGFYVVTYAQITELLPKQVAGTAVGVYNPWFFIGGALFQQIMGVILDSYGKVGKIFPVNAYRATFILCFVGMIVGTLGVFFSRDTMTQRLPGTEKGYSMKA